MEPIKKIQKRIRMRQNNLNEIENKPESTVTAEKPGGFKHFLYKFSIRSLVVICLFIGFLIYAKNDEKATFIKDKFGYSLDFTYVNTLADGIVNKILDFDIFKGLKDDGSDLVDASPSYQKLEENNFTNDDGKTYSIGSGKVAYVGEGLQGKKMIIVKTVDSIVISYVGVSETFVYENDWVDNKDIIASFDGEITMYFTKKGESLTYEDVIQSIS
jgi:hypothetical protein